MAFHRNRNRNGMQLRRLALEELEAREVPASLTPINDFTTPNTKALYVPLTVTNAVGTVTYSATSTDPLVHVQVVAGGTTIRLHVTGVDGTNTPFDGNLTFRLFDSMAPITTARIVQLVNQGFYDNLTFHRIIDGFVAQGGDPSGNGTGGSGTTIPDEFNTLLTFNSPGLLAMANSGDDTGDSQFFITDTDLTLAQQPQHLNFNHSIFGQLVDGFSTFTALMSTPVDSPNSGAPLNTVHIVSATVVANDPNGVLQVTAPASYTGTTSITVTPSDGGSSTGDTFNVSFITDAINDPAFLNPVADQTTTAGTPVTFHVTGTDLESDPLTFQVVSATSNGQTVNVQSQINQATGQVTVTPPAGFVGVIDLKLGVKDATGAIDTQVIKLTVTAGAATGSIDLQAASDTGVLSDDDVTGAASPKFTITAPAGATVAVTVNGNAAGNATATATAGQYTITLPAGLLHVGTNTIGGTATVGSGTPTQLTPITITYAPSLRSVYTVPGAAGSAQQLTFSYTSGETSAKSEFGFFKVDSLSGRIGTLNPGEAGYFSAAMSRRVLVFSTSAAAGDTKAISVKGGDLLAMYLIQNTTSAGLLASNPNNGRGAGALAFFSLTGANPDSFAHVSSADDPIASQVVYGFEDGTGGGDRDYNDVVVTLRRVGDPALVTLQVPGAANRSIAATAHLQTAKRSPDNTNPITSTTARGEIGFFVADSVNGAVGGILPGQAGYVAAVLARAQILFANGAVAGTSKNLNLATGQFLVFYFVPNGTAAGVLSANSTNSPSGSSIAYFSIPAANPDGQAHSRTVEPEKVSRPAPTASDPFSIHMMGKLNGVATDFDDVVFTIKFGS